MVGKLVSNIINPISHERIIVTGQNQINSLSWSLDGSLICSCSDNGLIEIWNTVTGAKNLDIRAGATSIFDVAWSPNTEYIASIDHQGQLNVWSMVDGAKYFSSHQHRGPATSVSWSSRNIIATGSEDRTVALLEIPSFKVTTLDTGGVVFAVEWCPSGRNLVVVTSSDVSIWSLKTRQRVLVSRTVASPFCASWSPDGKLIAVGSKTGSISILDASTLVLRQSLEGHTDWLTGITWSANSQFLATRSADARIRIWHRFSWQPVFDKGTHRTIDWRTAMAFHPHKLVLAYALGSEGHICLSEFDDTLATSSLSGTHRYVNAKVVLIGDSGVGKSALGSVLSGHSFRPTESTHGRFVWTMELNTQTRNKTGQETRETLLWDLAGQPGYRLIHQMHLSDATLAVILMDSRSETDPFSGVFYWLRAIRQAEQATTNRIPIKKVLVAARIDRGNISATEGRINEVVRKNGIESFHQTSAKESIGVDELRSHILQLINWSSLPRVITTDLFYSIRRFIASELKSGRVMARSSELLHTFNALNNSLLQELEFRNCLECIQARGLVKNLRFGGLVLLQPELLDGYASSVVEAAKLEPDGMGSILERTVLQGDFWIPPDYRIGDTETEQLLLIATIEDLISHEIALRQDSEAGPLLVFPSQFTRENPDMPDPPGRSLTVSFEGPLLSIYTTLAVRLAHSGHFSTSQMWKNAVEYLAAAGGVCGIHLRELDEGIGEITVFSQANASVETILLFENYVESHVNRKAVPLTARSRRLIVCPSCQIPVSDLQIAARRKMSFNWIACNVCDCKLYLDKVSNQDENHLRNVVLQMDQNADIRRNQEVSKTVIDGKKHSGEFDVFLCHNSTEKEEVKRLSNQLKELGIRPWLDEWELRPGHSWQEALETQISSIATAAVFVGESGFGPWQSRELRAFLEEFVQRGCPVIPVILPGVTDVPNLPVFLRSMMWVDFRKTDPDPMKQLMWGITGLKQ